MQPVPHRPDGLRDDLARRNKAVVSFRRSQEPRLRSPHPVLSGDDGSLLESRYLWTRRLILIVLSSLVSSSSMVRSSSSNRFYGALKFLQPTLDLQIIHGSLSRVAPERTGTARRQQVAGSYPLPIVDDTACAASRRWQHPTLLAAR
jgi:hypothetical protein